MTNDDKSAQEKYRDKTQRVTVNKNEYIKAKQYLDGRTTYPIGEEELKPAIAKKPNRVIAESLNLAIGSNDYEVTWLDRVLMFARNNELDEDEAVETIICTVLDDSGHIEETFRKPRLFSNDMW